MSDARGPRGQLGDIARQARELLGRVHESRWPGIEPPRPNAAPRSAVDTPREPRAVSRRPAAPAVRATPRPAPSTAGPRRSSTATSAAPAAAPNREEPHPWNSLEQIALAVHACTKCPLHATRARTVPGEGDAQARLLFVGEAPGADEDRLGRPFVGAAGQLLDKMIRAMGFAREQVFIANVLKCRPPGNRDPQDHEVEACLPYLRAQIALIRPEAICALGRHATQALLGRKVPLGKVRGRFQEYRGAPLLPTFHPSYLLRSPDDKSEAWKDLQQLMSLLELPLPGLDAHEERRR